MEEKNKKASDEKAQKRYMRVKDIKVTETSDPKEMLGKYLAERPKKTWTEEFTDEDTGEVTEVQRTEVVFTWGGKLTETAVSKIMFFIETGEIESVKVCDMAFPDFQYEPLLGLSVYTVVLHNEGMDLHYCVRAKSVEDAIQMALEYGAVYRVLTGYVYVCSVKIEGFSVEDDSGMKWDDFYQDDAEDDEEDKDWKSYYRVKGELMYFDAFLNKVQKEEGDLLVSLRGLDDIGGAKKKALLYFRDKWKDTLKNNGDAKLRMVKAQPVKIDTLVPIEYSKQWYEEEKKNSRTR
jgi:hypothetical protein|nr:MAG TPA: hypothetical protein [Caudoviricetes sp.]